MSDWMKDNSVSNIQTAIQSQTIQTALERNVSDLSPQALQSFLTQAPIPRMFYDTNSATFTTGANVTATWIVSSTTVDPYNMMVPSTGIFTLPIDGFYSLQWWIGCTGGATATLDVSFMDPPKSTFYCHHDINSQTTAPTLYIGSFSLIRPFRAGTPLIVNLGNGSAANLSAITTSLGVVWIAPFNNYQGGQN